MKDPLEELEYEDDQKMAGEVDAADEDKESISPWDFFRKLRAHLQLHHKLHVYQGQIVLGRLLYFWQ